LIVQNFFGQHFSLFFDRLLHQAALWDNAELLEDLLNGDELSCLNARDSWGRTALHAAATNESSQCLRILTQAGADLVMFCQILPLHEKMFSVLLIPNATSEKHQSYKYFC